MEPIPISALEHYAYCPRQCALIHLDGLWSDNTHTVRGARGHRRADTPSNRQERGRRVLRAVPLWSESLGLTGRADAIEILSSGAIMPVEYKIGRPHSDTAEIQLCAQAFCLEEMFAVRVDAGALWHSGPRRRTEVAIDDRLRQRTLAVIDSIRDLLQGTALPPAPNDARCAECQLLGHCLPAIVADPQRVTEYMDREVFGCAS